MQRWMVRTRGRGSTLLIVLWVCAPTEVGNAGSRDGQRSDGEGDGRDRLADGEAECHQQAGKHETAQHEQAALSGQLAGVRQR